MSHLLRMHVALYPARRDRSIEEDLLLVLSENAA